MWFLEFLADYLELDLGEVTKKLRSGQASVNDAESAPYPWMGRSLEELRELAEQEDDYDKSSHHNPDNSHLDQYHGDFRKRSLNGCGCGL